MFKKIIIRLTKFNNILFFGLIIMFIILISPYQISYAQLDKTNFTTYNNPNFGITIQYPSAWNFEEQEDDDFSKGVIFLVPTSPKKYMDKLSIDILDAEPNQSLHDLVNEVIEFNKKEMTGYKVIESTPIILNGNKAHKIVYEDNSELFGDVKGMLIDTIKGDKIYEILYTTEPDRYDELLPIIQEMINSLKITKDTDITIKHTQNNVTIKSEKNNHKEAYPKEHEQRERPTLPKPTLSEEIELAGTVNYVVDGDTLDINDIRIRLALVDTPERGYPGFKEAKEFVKKLCLEENAEVDMDDGQRRGSFGREIGVVYCDGKNLNEELIKNDLAVIDSEFCEISEFSSEIWAKPYC